VSPVGALFFILTWMALSLPIGILVGKIIAGVDREASRRGANATHASSDIRREEPRRETVGAAASGITPRAARPAA